MTASTILRSSTSLRRRLIPLYTAVFLQGFLLWVPVEKLFMTEIGFDPASVGVMAAAYAAVVPIIEIPSGILADRWSRRGVLIISSAALGLCALIGGLSNNVATYIVSALILGVYFAMYSGTLDAVVYDTVLEETGDSDDFEKRIGRVRLVESIALVASSLLGGWLAGLATPRLMYFLSVPIAALSIFAYLWFREPRLHKTEEATSLRSHLAVTYRTLIKGGKLLPIIGLAVLTALVLQVVFEFGPLWLVALATPAVLYGPYWAALTSTFGLGGLLAGKVQLNRLLPLSITVGLMIFASLVLTRQSGVLIASIAQVVLALLIVLASIHVTRLLHDAVTSTVRSGGLGCGCAVLDCVPADRPDLRHRQQADRRAHRELDDRWCNCGRRHFALHDGLPRAAHRTRDRAAGGYSRSTLQRAGSCVESPWQRRPRQRPHLRRVR